MKAVSINGIERFETKDQPEQRNGSVLNIVVALLKIKKPVQPLQFKSEVFVTSLVIIGL